MSYLKASTLYCLLCIVEETFETGMEKGKFHREKNVNYACKLDPYKKKRSKRVSQHIVNYCSFLSTTNNASTKNSWYV